MNVIVSNRQKEIIDNANIDAIKDLNGLFNVDDLVNKFKNYFFSKMILDATSVVDFATRDVLQKLVNEIGPDRLIILLPNKPEPPEEFKKLLVELKIYNFSNNIEDVVNFIEKPNTYENIMKGMTNSYNNSNEFYVDNSIKDGENRNIENNNIQNANVVDNQEINNNVDNMNNMSNMNNLNPINDHASLGDIMNRFNVDGNSSNNNIYQTPNMSLESPIISNNLPMNNVSNGRNVFLNMDDYNDNTNYNVQREKRIIGFRNVTEHAGSTTLIYMLQNIAQKMNTEVLSVEINRNDFRLFRNNKMISVNENDISNVFNSLRESVVFVDLNDCLDDSFCTDIVYLVEPSLIKLNRLMATDKSIFSKLINKKVVLNQSMLSNSDVPILEREAGISFFDNIPSLNDRSDNMIIEGLFKKLID